MHLLQSPISNLQGRVPHPKSLPARVLFRGGCLSREIILRPRVRVRSRVRVVTFHRQLVVFTALIEK
jgi:hypothetical protein